MSLSKSIRCVVYIFINALFIVKYSYKVSINFFSALMLYLFFILGLNFLITKKIYKKTKLSFLVVSVLFFLLTIYINYSVDGNTLNIDRWSAMQVAIEALLNNEYPYQAKDHLGGRTSNLPFLLFLGIPFYLIGNIGLLQSFSFLVFVYAIVTIFEGYKERLFSLLLLISSPAYLWEIYAKSDLMSNFIFVLLFLIIFQKKKEAKEFVIPSVLSLCSALLLLTRLTAVIPIVLLVFQSFYEYSVKKKVVFALVFMVTIFFASFMFFKNVLDLTHFQMYNPFTLQNRQLPFWLSLIIVIIPFLLSFKVTNLKNLIKYSSLCLVIPIGLAFSLSVFKNGFYECVYMSAFDISYFNILMPFLLVDIVFNKD